MMFNKRVMISGIALLLCIGAIIWKWVEDPIISFNRTPAGMISSERFEIDLNGNWKMYRNLRQALVAEGDGEEVTQGQLNSTKTIHIPSNQDIRVITRVFKLPSEWSARTTILEFKGVRGEVEVYLNGIEGKNCVGNFTSEGGTERLFVPANILRYGQDNQLYLVLSAPPSQERTIFGLKYPKKGKITGSVVIQGVRETCLENPQVKVAWNNSDANVGLEFQIVNRGFSDYGPWNVYGVISDGSAEVAKASAVVTADENPVHSVNLNFTIPNGRKWTTSDPYLYKLYLTVTNPKGDKDNLSIPLALSTFSFHDGVFTENGAAVKIKGLALLQEDREKLRSSGEIASWLKRQKENGFNLIYFPGELPDEVWLYEADNIGIGVWVNLPGTAMMPVNRLTPPETWANLIRANSFHPSLWAYTAGIGYEVHPQGVIENYWEKTNSLSSSIPVFLIRLTNNLNFQSEYSPMFTGGRIKGVWGTIDFPLDKTRTEEGWANSKKFRIYWAVFISVITWITISTKSWRYRELSNPKPRRDLRRAWFWQWIAFISRQLTVAGMVIMLIMNEKVPWYNLIPEQWPLWNSIKLQSPILLWLTLGTLFAFLRMLQVGVAAPYMPDKPAPLGLVLWLERRYSWTWLIAVLWALSGWLPPYVPILAYLALIVLFLPLRVHDVRRLGGRYISFLIVPGLLGGVCVLLSIVNWSDWLYLGQLTYSLYFQG